MEPPLTFNNSISHITFAGEWLFVTVAQDNCIYMVQFSKPISQFIIVSKITRLNFTTDVQNFYPRKIVNFKDGVLIIQSIDSMIFCRISNINQQVVYIGSFLV